MQPEPSAAKLAAGLCFAAVAFFAATLFEPSLSEGQRAQWFTAANAGLGFIVGWRFMGPATGRGYRLSARAGIGTSVWLLIWALVVFSLREMLVRSWDKRYRTPTEALGNTIEIATYFFGLALSVEVLGTLVVGGMIAGLVAEFSDRKWD